MDSPKSLDQMAGRGRRRMRLWGYLGIVFLLPLFLSQDKSLPRLLVICALLGIYFILRRHFLGPYLEKIKCPNCSKNLFASLIAFRKAIPGDDQGLRCCPFCGFDIASDKADRGESRFVKSVQCERDSVACFKCNGPISIFRSCLQETVTPLPVVSHCPFCGTMQADGV